jgi:hypothetical protein
MAVVAKLVQGASLLALVACSGAGGTAAPSPTPDLGAEYLRLIAPSNTADDALFKAAGAAPLNQATIRAAAQSVLDADIALNTAFIGFGKEVPTNVQPDVAAARVAISKDIVDIQSVLAASGVVALETAVLAWATNANSEINVFVLLRSDLGLPPPSGASPLPTAS